MKYYESMKELVGNTPMVKLLHAGAGLRSEIFAKLELYNPSGSVKDRIGEYMIREAEQKGMLRKGSTIIEATAGNTGLGVAFAALNKGYHILFVVPEKFSEEKQQLMKALGAELIHTPREKGMQGAVEKAEELRRYIKGAVSLEQFKNPANPRAHYETTGPEIFTQMEGKLDYVVLGAGSGGTFTGILSYLKEQDPKIKGVLADPIGSTIGGGEHGDYNIEGIGNDFVADTMNMDLVDEVIKISDAQAFAGSRKLAATEGIFAGSSSGAAFAAAEKIAAREEGKHIVVVFPDRGDRYFSEHLYG